MSIPIEYLSFIRREYELFIDNKPLDDDNLDRYIAGCFKDIAKLRPLPRMWICCQCLTDRTRELALDSSFGHGDKPKLCGVCGNRVYQIGTFQARSTFSGTTFMYACYYLLTQRFHIPMIMSHSETRMYDYEVAKDVVIEAKGSPRVISNIDGSTSKLARPGMGRSDTEKKAFRNAEQWHALFPKGHFFILTSKNPDHLRGYRSETVSAICDVTNAKQLTRLTEEIKNLVKTRTPVITP